MFQVCNVDNVGTSDARADMPVDKNNVKITTDNFAYKIGPCGVP